MAFAVISSPVTSWRCVTCSQDIMLNLFCPFRRRRFSRLVPGFFSSVGFYPGCLSFSSCLPSDFLNFLNIRRIFFSLHPACLSQRKPTSDLAVAVGAPDWCGTTLFCSRALHSSTSIKMPFRNLRERTSDYETMTIEVGSL